MNNLELALHNNWIKEADCETQGCEKPVKYYDPDCRSSFYCEDCVEEVIPQWAEEEPDN